MGTIVVTSEEPLIYIFGTSHVSEDSLELVEQKIEEINPEMVALELDMMRLDSLLNEDRNQRGGSLFVRLLKYFQESIGEETGVMPGEEMLHAYRIAEKKGIEVALIDQDIRQTVQNLKQVSFAEKLKAAAQLMLGILMPSRMEVVSSIPDEQVIDQLLFEMEFKFPEMYSVLVEERNRHMVESLKMLEKDVEGDIVAFVGAAHRKAVQEEFDQR